ncbi:MAG: winged helix-turn-helix domain-containing protein [Candidatus Aegiribacteria sp.]|nr:winged helix-turn-helix domain-containing protein [Candidatus Aegiribacteria sp.]
METYDFSFIYALLGETVSRTLFYIARFGDSYPTEIANNFLMNQQRVQYRMEKLEDAGILKSKLVGRTRLYRINPRYVLKNELMNLLQKALEYLPEEEIESFYTKRRRPRTKGKTLKRYRGNAE